jgi:Fic family protein
MIIAPNLSPMMLDKLQHLQAKKAWLDSFRPLPPELLANLEQWLKVELTYSSNAIEGNTLTRSETAIIIEKGLTIGGKTIREHLEAENHAKAHDFVNGLVAKSRLEITLDDILQIHQLILSNIEPQHAGKFRNISVRISGSLTVLPNPAKLPRLMVEFMNWLHSTTAHPLIIASEAQYRFVTIHPFIDGNGRTARLLTNLLLLQTGYTPALLRPEDRVQYIKAIETATSSGSLELFHAVIFEAVERTLDIYVEAIENSIN